MASGEAAKVTPSSDIAANSETTVEIKIKTLDSQTYTLRVDKCVPVPTLKEQIAGITGVLSEQQRLICRGRVLKDDQLLSAYHVEDGHTLHLVVRQPPQSSIPSTNHVGLEGSSGHQGTSSSPGSAHNHGSQGAFVFESVNLDQGDLDGSLISRIISGMLDSIGSASGGTSGGTGNIASDIREMITERLQRSSSDSGISDVTPSNPNPSNLYTERWHEPSPTVPLAPPVIPDSLTTLSQYLGFMRDGYRREGFIGTNVSEHISNAEGASIHLSGGHNRFPAAQVGLPTPASLAEILLSTRQLLMEQTGDCLSQLASQLGDHASITNPLARMNVQSSVMRSGILIRNLGSMLLELSRTTMTLRMGQIPAEAVVNAGPANFISADRPNPLMVQAVPFYPGSNISGSLGPENYGHGLEGGPPAAAPFVPRNIEIRIRTSRGVSVGSSNANEPAGGQQQQEQTDPARNSPSANVVHQAMPGGDGGVRVVPLRTVVAVPSGANPLPSDSSAGSIRVFYPLLARVRHTGNANVSDARGAQASNQTQQGSSEADRRPFHQSPVQREPFHQSPVQRENLDPSSGGAVRDGTSVSASSTPVVSALSPPANESAAHLGFVSSQQTTPSYISDSRTQVTDTTVEGIESHDAASAATQQGLFFSNVLQQLMPLISQGGVHRSSATNPSSSSAQLETSTLSGSSGTRHQRDPPEDLPEAPSPKRSKSSSD